MAVLFLVNGGSFPEERLVIEPTWRVALLKFIISRDFETSLSSQKVENQRQLAKKNRDCERHHHPIKILRET